jgi:hypothetical protein
VYDAFEVLVMCWNNVFICQMYVYAETVEIKVWYMSNGEAGGTPGVAFDVGAKDGLAGVKCIFMQRL